MKVQVGALVVAFVAFAGSAQAAITSTQLTTPSNDPYVAFLPGDDPALSVAGTASGTGSTVDIRCYTGGGYQTLASGVAVSGGAFSTDIHMNFSSEFLPETGCELRAVDPNDTQARPPGDVGDPFAGVYVRVSYAIPINFLFSGSSVSNFEVLANGPKGLFEIRSASGALDESAVYDGLDASDELIGRSGTLDLSDFAGTRSEIRIDGADAYGAEAAGEVAQIQNGGNPLPGQPSVTMTQTIDPQTGGGTVRASEPIVKCSGTTSCTSFVPTGVTLETSWTTSQDGLLAVQSSKWVDTDGHSHALDALYGFRAESGSNPGGFEFPGDASFGVPATDDTVSLTAAPGVYVFKSDNNVADNVPVAAFAYSSVPSGPLRFVQAISGTYDWVIPYQRTIPVDGGLTLSFGYAQGLKIADTRALAQAATAGFPPETPLPPAPPPPPAPPAPPPASPVPQPPKPVPASLAVAGKPRASHGKVTLKLECTGTAGTCKARLRLTAGKKLYASVSKTIALGRTVTLTVKLNAKGRKALKRARHHRLRLKLTVQQTSPTARTVEAVRLVVKR